MAQVFGDWDTDPDNNTSVGTTPISIAEGMAPGNVNDALREIMAAAANTLGFTPLIRDFETRAAVISTAVRSDIELIITGGYTTAGDGGGALHKRVGAQPSHALKVQSADGAWWEGVVSFMTPEMFGAVGDGATNDRTKLQDMFDCTVSDTIIFGAGKTYYFETNGNAESLRVSRGMNLHMNGSEFYHKTIGAANNNAIIFDTTRDNEETWTETISAYATVLTITSSLSVGDNIYIELGEFPTDNSVPHVIIWAVIIANSGTTITIDKPIPFDIGGTSHSLWPVTPHRGSTIDTLRITQEGNGVSALLLQRIRDFHLENYICKDVTKGVGIIDGCENIYIGSMSGNGRDTAGQHGGALTVWASKTVSIGIIDWIHTVFDQTVIFLEAGAYDVSIGKLHVNRVLSETATNDVIHVSGLSDLRIGQFTLRSNQNDRLIFAGGSNPFRVTIDDLVMWCGMNVTPLSQITRVNRLEYLGKRYFDKVQLSKRTFINENTSYDLEWFYGVPLRVFMRLDDITKVDGLNIRHEDASVTNLLILLTSGEWTDVTAQLPGKALLRGTRFRLVMDGKVGNSAVLDSFVEYWRDPDVTELSNLASWDENRGETTDTTDGSGDITIAHGLGSEPRTVHVQMQGTTDYNPTVHTKGATSFKVRVSDNAGAAVTSTAVTVSWSAGL